CARAPRTVGIYYGLDSW
nr:immunoglobulin heavy chain junction region [Macaca mulatta]